MTTMRARRPMLPEEVRKRVDADIWDNYHREGAVVIAMRHLGVDRHYVVCRAFKIGARLTGEHLLEEEDYANIRALLKEGMHPEVVAEKFEVRVSVIIRIGSLAGIFHRRKYR